jgi:hypothetical protein
VPENRAQRAQGALPLPAKAFAIDESLMENPAIAMDGLSKRLNDKPQQAPTRFLPQAHTPHYALTRLQKLLHDLRASESGYCS